MPDDVRATIDRVTDGIAILLVEPDGREVELPAGELPEDATEGSVVLVRLDPLEVVEVDHEATRALRAAAENRLARMRRSRSRGRFRRPSDR
jgi:hypothetical protein